MSKITVTGFALLSVLFLGNSSNYAAQPKQRRFRHAHRDASKNDRRKRQRDAERRSERVERKQCSGHETRRATVRRRDEFVFSHSRFQRPVARARAGVDRAGPARPTGSTASRRAGRISQAARRRETFTRRRLRPRCARRQNRFHVFQRRRTSIRLRCQCAVAHHRKVDGF